MPKTMKTMDGNNAAAYVAYAFSEVAAIYPITPSSPMAEYCDEWAAHGKKNIFGDIVNVTEMQSEAGAAGAMQARCRAERAFDLHRLTGSAFMIPNMYKRRANFCPACSTSARERSPLTRSPFSAIIPTSWRPARPVSVCSLRVPFRDPRRRSRRAPCRDQEPRSVPALFRRLQNFTRGPEVETPEYEEWLNFSIWTR